MLRKRFVILMVPFALASLCFAGSGPNMREGLWEITMKMKMPGMEMPPVTHTQCLTKKDFVPQSSQPGQDCEITHSEVVGDTVRWTMECTGEGGEMKGSGAVTYKGDSFEGTIKMIMRDEQDMEVTSYISGRRVGECN